MFFIFTPLFNSDTGSMKPTIKDGQFLILNKLAYGIQTPNLNQYTTGFYKSKYLNIYNKPKKGDIVIFHLDKNKKTEKLIKYANSNFFMKRIIATEGDQVYVKGGDLYLKLKNETTFKKQNLLSNEMLNTMLLLTISENHVFLVGDNFTNSIDSRYFGEVNINNLFGKVILFN
jgi:signal peptidase I